MGLNAGISRLLRYDVERWLQRALFGAALVVLFVFVVREIVG